MRPDLAVMVSPPTRSSPRGFIISSYLAQPDDPNLGLGRRRLVAAERVFMEGGGAYAPSQAFRGIGALAAFAFFALRRFSIFSSHGACGPAVRLFQRLC